MERKSHQQFMMSGEHGVAHFEKNYNVQTIRISPDEMKPNVTQTNATIVSNVGRPMTRGVTSANQSAKMTIEAGRNKAGSVAKSQTLDNRELIMRPTAQKPLIKERGNTQGRNEGIQALGQRMVHARNNSNQMPNSKRAQINLKNQILPVPREPRRNIEAHMQTQKIPAFSGLSSYPSQTQFKSEADEFLSRTEGQKLRIAIPQNKNTAIQYWKQRDAHHTKQKASETTQKQFWIRCNDEPEDQLHSRKHAAVPTEMTLSKPKGNFFASLGNKETSSVKFTFNTANQKKQQVAQTPQSRAEIQQANENLVIFTDMNVDHHDFDIKSRRVIREQMKSSKMQYKPLSSMPSEGHIESLPSLNQMSLRTGDKPTISRPVTMGASRPMSGGSSAFLAAQQNLMLSKGNQQLKSIESLNAKPSQLASCDTLNEEDSEAKSSTQGKNDQPLEGGGFGHEKNAQNFSRQIMMARPTTALIGTTEGIHDNLPYPELFDRSERTFAATFAKYGDLSYFTPVQRIGNYMEFQQRLTKRHLMDLIAFQKTSKQTVKVDDEFGKNQNDYLDHCLFHGLMLNEEPDTSVVNAIMDHSIPEVTALTHRSKLIAKLAYNPCSSRQLLGLQIEKIWSAPLLKQLELSIMRMLKYIDGLDCIKDEELSHFRSEWILNALVLIPMFLQKSYKGQLQSLFQEVQLTYKRSMKQAIMDYILRSPDERRRLHILMLPQQVASSQERQVLNGGYSIGIYQGTHHRKISAENEIKFRLITNNIVVSSLQSWWQEFRNIQLIDFQNFSFIVKKRQEKSVFHQTGGEILLPETVYNTLDIDNFLSYQEAVLEKNKALMKYIWHRGAILIVKKYKFLRTKEQQRLLFPGNSAKSRWSYQGFIAEPQDYGYELDSQMHETIEQLQEEIRNFSYTGGKAADEKLTPYQAYTLRTAVAHKNVQPVQSDVFRSEKEHHIGAVINNLFEGAELKDLVDIRQCPSYISFIKIIGSFINYDENGYEGLAKEYKRELKYAAGNLMRIQLRQMVESSVATFCNFFAGFKTFDELRRNNSSFLPLRYIRPTLTKFTSDAARKQRMQEEARKKKDLKPSADASGSDARLQKQLEKRQKAISTAKASALDVESNYVANQDNQTLSFPDFLDYQDYANPIFHLELLLGAMQDPQESQKDRHLLKLTHNLEFNKTDQQILEHFDAFYYDLVTCFNDFSRPEFCKVRLFNKRELENQQENDHTRKIQLEQQRKQRRREMLNIPKESATIREAFTSKVFHYSLQSMVTVPPLDFDKILYTQEFDNPFAYEKYMGRIKIEEALHQTGEKRIAPADLEEGETLFAMESVKRAMDVAHVKEDFFKTKRDKIMNTLRDHLRETKRIHELYEQFKPIIQGEMQERVMNFVQSQSDPLGMATEYSSFLAELKNYKSLALQLPQRVSFPLFEVGLRIVNRELINRVENFIFTVLTSFETALENNSKELCKQFEKIYEKLQKKLETAEEVVQMDQYKNRLLQDMAQMQRRLDFNKKSVYFLLTQNCHSEVFLEPKEEQGQLVEGVCNKYVQDLLAWPSKLSTFMDECDEKHADQRLMIEKLIFTKKQELEKGVKEFQEKLKQVVSYQSVTAQRQSRIDFIKEAKLNLDNLEELRQQITSEESLLFGNRTEFSGLASIQRQFEPYFELWMKIDQVMNKRNELSEANLQDIDAEEVEKLIKESTRSLQKLQKQFGSQTSGIGNILQIMAQELKKLNDMKPVIDVLCSKALKDRHWQQIKMITGAQFDDIKGQKLSQLMKFAVQNEENLNLLKENIEKAKKQDRLENILQQMQKEWQNIYFDLKTFKDTDIPILSGANIELMQSMLDEHVMQSQMIKNNPEVEPIILEASEWEHTMLYIQDILEIWLRVQTNYLFLVPIFNAGGIQDEVKNLLDHDSFKKIDLQWRSIMNELRMRSKVLSLEKNFPTLIEDLRYQDERLETIQLGLNSYLESKRDYFSRFYFLPNEDLIEILGDSQKPKRIQKHLKKIFEGINEVVFREQQVGKTAFEQIYQIESREGEKVQLLNPIYPHTSEGQVEKWLLQLEEQMKQSVQRVITDALKDFPTGNEYLRNKAFADKKEPNSETMKKYNQEFAEWLTHWQSQVLIVVQTIIWTNNVENALQTNDSFRQLINLYHSYQAELVIIVNMVRDKLPNLLRLTLSSLIVIIVRAREIINNLAKQRCMSIDDFNWISNLRYYFDKKSETVKVSMVMSELTYANEFLGNTGRLVITPLTERCYRTLMSALTLNLGGAPEGPAGTGKTETTKDLAKAVAVYCRTFNCGEGLNAKFMSRFFKGLASGGSWSCFDEFNRIELEVLSVIAQQILEIQRAKAAKLSEFNFEDSMIKLQPNCSVFITMNPDYAGRSALPDNLKALFRPVAMMIPDYSMIAEISLYSFGFLQSRLLAKKIVQTYRLCSEQLSFQQHYDYGMRAVKTVLTAAKNLKYKQAKKQASIIAGSVGSKLPSGDVGNQTTFISNEESEETIILRSIRDVNLPKFLAEDIQLFEGIISDLFQGMEIPETDYPSLRDCLYNAMLQLGYQTSQQFTEKVFQLYDMIKCRHGLMIVGPANAGKTAVRTSLEKALNLVAVNDQSFEETQTESFVVNPKSVTIEQLYGRYDFISQEFQDGIIGSLFRKCAYKNTKQMRQWIVFDGPVDPNWIENMNTVLDDNKRLCLVNGEIIQMTDNMNMIFETHDLTFASPATVSRLGMVFCPAETYGGWYSLLQSWLNNFEQNAKLASVRSVSPQEVLTRIQNLFKLIYAPTLATVLNQCKLIIPTSDTQITSSLLKIMEAMTNKEEFIRQIHSDSCKTEEVFQRIDMIFLFATNWSLGAITDESGQKVFQKRFDEKARETFKIGSKQFRIERHCLISDLTQLPQNFKIDDLLWSSWKDLANRPENNPEINDETPINEIIITTPDILKQVYLLNLLVKASKPTLFIGGTGTGKTIAVNRFMRSLDTSFFETTTICFSSRSSANITQETIQNKLEKRNRRLFGPQSSKRMVIFVDDLNMPTIEKHGAQPPIELIRQWFDHKSWYDYKEKDNILKVLKGLVYVGAMCPHEGGKNLVSPRFSRHFNIIACSQFDQTVLNRIYGRIIDWHIQKEKIKGTNSAKVLKSIVEATIDVFNFAQINLKPTPAKSHYLFNLRDISRVIQGIHMMHKFLHSKVDKLVRLWVHEIGRVFTDRLGQSNDQMKVFKHLPHACRNFIKEDFANSLRSCLTKQDIELGTHVEHAISLMTQSIRFTDLLDSSKKVDNREYDEVSHEKYPELLAKLNSSLKDGYNMVTTKPMDLVLFDFAVTHILRITRVLKISKGNLLLIGLGGSGRTSLSVLSAYLMEQDLNQTKQTMNYKQDDWTQEVKEVMMKAGLQNHKSVFLLNDQVMKHSYVLADVNNLINQYEIPGILSKDDRVTICETARLNARNEGRSDLFNTTNQNNLMDYFTKKVEKNLHVILCMSPTGTALQERIRMFPSLVNCCTIDWFTDWPQEALFAVTQKFLDEIPDIDKQQRNIQEVCFQFHNDSHEMSRNYLKLMKRHTYITPTSYLDLMQIFQETLRKQREKIQNKHDDYETGINKMTETQEAVAKMQKDLNEKQPQLEDAQIQAQILEKEIAKESEEVVEPQKKMIQQEEKIAHEIALEAENIKMDCENDLKRAMPILKQAQAALDTIKSKDIVEIRSLQNPPSAIRLTLHAVCIMMDRKVEKTPKKDNPKVQEENWWFTAQKLMNENFLDQLLSFDKDNIEERIMQKIRTTFLADPEFKPQLISKASRAAKGLCEWIIKLEQYHTVVTEIKPKKNALAESKMRHKQAEQQLRTKQDELKKIVMKYEGLQLRLSEVADKRRQLFEEIKDCEIKLQRAKILIEGLGGEEERWKESLQKCKVDLKTLVPDVLLSSVIIAYLGPFISQFRQPAIERWIKLMGSYTLQVKPLFSLESVLGEQIVIKQWHKTGLPSDGFSIENGIILFNALKWPLMIDPQGQANRWIKSMETRMMQESTHGMRIVVIKPEAHDLSRQFEQAIRMGLAVLLEGVGEQVDPLLDPVLLKQTFTSQGNRKIRFCDEEIDYADEFKLYMTTKHVNPHYQPELTTKVTIINFMITNEILCDQLLNLVVKMENEVLEDERVRLIQMQYENNKQMSDIEKTILKVLRESQGNILDDEKAINILRQSEQLSEEIKKRIAEALKTQAVIGEARKKYYPIARHASMLFFVVQKLSFVDVMYQYSLNWFINLFRGVVSKTKYEEEKPNSDANSQQDGYEPAQAQQIPAENRVKELIESFTSSFYSNVCRSIFEKDKLLFSFLLTASIRLMQGKLTEVQYKLLVMNMDGHSVSSDLQNPCPDWLPNATWNKLCLCRQEDPLFDGLIRHFEKNKESWHDLYDCETLDDALFPPNETSISKEWPLFMKLIIVKVFRQDKLPELLQVYVYQEMGKEYLQPPQFELEYSFNDSNCSTPLIFILPGTDPLQQLNQFAIQKKKYETMKVISLGQGQGPKAERCISDARKHGNWVLLQNCHLYPSWMHKLEQICENMEAKAGVLDNKNHPHFRLWLTSYPSDDFPSSILQNGIKMTNEPPIGLKANMIGSYKTEPLNDQLFFEQSKNPAVFKKLAFSLTMFHAILLQRRNFGSLGFNIKYDFTVSDLQISMRQLSHFVDNYQTVPFIALKYLIGECNYGGRVTSLQDNRILSALLEDFMDKKVLEQGYSHLTEDKTLSYVFPSGDNPFYTYVDKIQGMPTTEQPELFGFHANADIVKNLDNAKLLLGVLLSIGEVEGAVMQEEEEIESPKATRNVKEASLFSPVAKLSKATKKEHSIIFQSVDDSIAKICQAIVDKLPREQFNVSLIQSTFPIVRENSMNAVLVQEIISFNRLYNLITKSIDQILQAQSGDILMTQELSYASDQLYRGLVPDMWKQISYPSLKSLAGYISDLSVRMQMLNKWILNMKPPEVFWISGFYQTQSFLTAILQNFARKNRIEIDLLEFEFKFTDSYDPTDYETEVFDMPTARERGLKMEEPADGALISGLFFEGADWDRTQHCICEQAPKQLFCKAPIIWLKPTIIQLFDPTTLTAGSFSDASNKPAAFPNSKTIETQRVNLNKVISPRHFDIASLSEGNNSREVVDFSQQTKFERVSYKCPLYKTTDRRGTLSTTGHSTNFIFYIDTPIVPQTVDVETNRHSVRSMMKKSSTIASKQLYNQNSNHWVKRGTALFCSLPH